jgi:hypothetical protein
LAAAFASEFYAWRISYRELRSRKGADESMWDEIIVPIKYSSMWASVFCIDFNVHQQLELAIDRIEQSIRHHQRTVKRVYRSGFTQNFIGPVREAAQVLNGVRPEPCEEILHNLSGMHCN